jgi:hypothetical protein
MIGILAYGSLLSNPGPEIRSVLDYVIPDVVTPFPVEYARRSLSRTGAPTLVQVDFGNPVNGIILVLKDHVTSQNAKDMLYRRERHKESKMSLVYDDEKQRKKQGSVLIEYLKNFHRISEVYYTQIESNFPEILSKEISEEVKADLLADAAIKSINLDTYGKGLDGIQYLADNIDAGVITSLTEVYRQALLQKAGKATDLDQARRFFAHQKGIFI